MIRIMSNNIKEEDMKNIFIHVSADKITDLIDDCASIIRAIFYVDFFTIIAFAVVSVFTMNIGAVIAMFIEMVHFFFDYYILKKMDLKLLSNFDGCSCYDETDEKENYETEDKQE